MPWTSVPIWIHKPAKTARGRMTVRLKQGARRIIYTTAKKRFASRKEEQRRRVRSFATNTASGRALKPPCPTWTEKTGVKRLRVRGLCAVSLCVTLKAAAVNILRAVAFKNRQNDGEKSPGVINSAVLSLFRVVKKQFLLQLNNLQNICKQFTAKCQFELNFD